MSLFIIISLKGHCFFPAIYVPGFSERVFYQDGIGWEWGIVIGMTLIFVIWCEVWKLIREPLYLRMGFDIERAYKSSSA